MTSEFTLLLHEIVSLICIVHGCEVGYVGYNCTEPCRYPSFGYRCQHVCNCTQDMCNHKTGCSLPQICKDGYYGPDCIFPCRYPSYGTKCQQECELIVCNHIKGCHFTTESTTFDEGWLEGKQLINTIIAIGNCVLVMIIGLSITLYVRKYRLQRKQIRKRTNTEP